MVCSELSQTIFSRLQRKIKINEKFGNSRIEKKYSDEKKK